MLDLTEMRTIEREGLALHFLRVPSSQANAPIVVFSHGFPGNANDWLGQFSVFANRCEIIAPFMHGTFDGESVPKARLRGESLVKDVRAIISSVDPTESRPLYFVGHDLGCFINTTLAQFYSARTQGMVNINGLGLRQYFSRLMGPSQWIKSYYVLLLQFSPIRKLVSHLMPDFFLRQIYRMSGVASTDALFRHDKRVMTSIYIYRVLFKRFFSFARHPFRKIAAPTVFIWGNKDVFLDIPTRKEVDRFYERGEVRILRGGHWVNRSNKEQVNRILARLLGEWTKGGTHA